MTKQELVQKRSVGFEKLYDAYYEFFVESLCKDSSKYNKFYLQLQARFADDLALQKKVWPIYSEFVSNPDEKQCCARAALYDALVANTFGSYLNASEQVLHNRMDELEDLIKQSGEKVNAVPKAK